jgi:hypothetical protein
VVVAKKSQGPNSPYSQIMQKTATDIVTLKIVEEIHKEPKHQLTIMVI